VLSFAAPGGTLRIRCRFWEVCVPGPDPSLLPRFGVLLAYGPAPGVELIPYFIGLATWAGLALTAVLWWPVAALLRRFRNGSGSPPAAKTGAPIVPSVPESPGDASQGPT
jgi:hypothetical protein